MNPPTAPSPPKAGTRKPLLFTLLLTLVFLAIGFISRARTNAHLAWTFLGVAGFLLGWQLILFVRSGRKGPGFAWEFAPTPSHYVQAMVQLSFYAYWGWYWRNVYAEAPLILAQVAFLYVFDALVTWSRGQTLRLGFGPWPIIFSTNLFMWFHDDWFVFQFVMVAIGVLGKQFIRWRRGGKLTHIFNPSAFGLTIISLVLIFTNTTRYTWGEAIAATQAFPPHPFTEIFLGGLVVQYLFSVTLLTFSAAAMLGLLSLAFTHITGVYYFVDSNIPIAVFLGLHLLMTDPATTPHRSLGRIIFGGLYGAAVFAAVYVLHLVGAPGFYDKLLIVPVLNLSVPLLDRLGSVGLAEKYSLWEQKIGPRKMNIRYMGGWIALFAVMLATGFLEGPHPGRTISFWKRAAEANRPYAAEQLRRMVHDFDRNDLDYPPETLFVADAKGKMSQEQAQGTLYNQVGAIYAEGKFVPADFGKAARYFDKACADGNTDGCANLALAYFRKTLTDEPVDVGRALSTLAQSGAATNTGLTCAIVAYGYYTGQGLPLDKARARQFYEKGAALGDLDATKALAQMLFTGEGGPEDHTAAASWWQKAADAKDGPSCLYLARMYHKGDGVSQDEAKAIALLKTACDLGAPHACDMLNAAQKESDSTPPGQ